MGHATSTGVEHPEHPVTVADRADRVVELDVVVAVAVVRVEIGVRTAAARGVRRHRRRRPVTDCSSCVSVHH